MDLSTQERPGFSLSRMALAGVATGGAALFALAWGIAAQNQYGHSYILGAFAVYLPASLIIVLRIARFHPHTQFGFANGITLIRLVVCSLLAGLAVEVIISSENINVRAAWFFFAIAVGSLILDGFDGLAARCQGLSSPFGARFDMEVDALQILALSVVAFALTKAGWWILISGLLRYVFMAASCIWPVLDAELPSSWRRKTVAVIQGGVVAALLAPIIVPPLSIVAAGVALALLLYSFAVDIIWLLRERRSPQ